MTPTGSAGFQSVAGPLEQMDGFSHAYFLVDPRQRQGDFRDGVGERGGVSASVAKADDLRKRGSEAGGRQG